MTKKSVTIRFPIWKDFTFKEVFSDEAVAKPFLEKLLGIHIQKLIYLQAEDEIRPYGESRWERLDILAIDENGVVYNIEMQGEHLEVIPFRYRSNGSGLDMKLIPKGIRTNDLKNIPKRVTIYICREDPFGKNLRQYTIYNCITEIKERMDDGTELICLNAKGTEGKVHIDIEKFLNYVKDGTDDGTNAFVHMIHQRVIELNENEEFVRHGMTLEEKFADRYDDGRIEGKEEGKAEGIRGTADILKETGFSNDEIIRKIATQFHLTREEAEKYLN